MNTSNPSQKNSKGRNFRSSKNKKRFSMQKSSGQSIRPADGNKQGNDSNQSADKGDRSNRRNGFYKNRRPNRPEGQKQTPHNAVTPIARKYEHFMEMYLNTRRKFFSLFFADDKKQREKSEKTYLAAAQALRDFEKTLSDDGKSSLKQYLNEGKEDTTISQKMQETGEYDNWERECQEIPDLSDPHTLRTQLGHSFSQDLEESIAAADELSQFMKKN